MTGKATLRRIVQEHQAWASKHKISADAVFTARIYAMKDLVDAACNQALKDGNVVTIAILGGALAHLSRREEDEIPDHLRRVK